MAEFADVSPWILWPVVLVLYAAGGAATAGWFKRSVRDRRPADDLFSFLFWPVCAVVLFLTPMCPHPLPYRVRE